MERSATRKQPRDGLFSTLNWNPFRIGLERIARRVRVRRRVPRVTLGSVRQAQIDELLRDLAARDHPLIVAGDFNADWQSASSPLRRLVDAADLHMWRPQVTDLGSYDDGEDRLDWILISASLHFDDYRIATDVVSDHRAVIAVISRRP